MQVLRRRGREQRNNKNLRFISHKLKFGMNKSDLKYIYIFCIKKLPKQVEHNCDI